MTVLNDQQNAFRLSPLQDAKVFGNPGVGKTTGIIHKVCHHYYQGELKNKRSFLIVMFTNNAQKEFIERSKRELVNKDLLFSHRNVMTIHKLAGKIFRHFSNAKNCDVSTVVAAARSLICQTPADALRSIPLLHDLTLMIIDEAQDISDVQYDFLMQIKHKLHNHCILIGDPNQNIFQFQGGSDRFLLDYDGKCFYWTINNRSSKRIVEFANYFRPNDFLPTMVASRQEASYPIEVYRSSIEQIMDTVLRILADTKVERSDIAIIGPVKKSHRQYNSYRNIGLSLLENLLSSCSIPFVAHYPSENATDTKPKRQPGKINLHTIHSSKGDEFHTVLLLNFHFFTQGKRPTYEDYNRYTYLWWVAVTRARDRLVILMDKDKEHWPLLQTVPTSLYRMHGIPIVVKSFEVEVPLFPKTITVEHFLDNVRNERLHDLEKLVQCTIHESSIVQPHIHIPVSPFVQNVVRTWFLFLAHQRAKSTSTFTQHLVADLDNRLSIPTKFRSAFPHLLSITGCAELSLQDLYQYKDNWVNDVGKELYFYLSGRMKGNVSYTLCMEDGLVHKDDNKLRHYCFSLEKPQTDHHIFQTIVKICLYQYQVHHEKKYMWENRHKLVKEMSSIFHVLPILQEILSRSPIDHHTLLDHRTASDFLQMRGHVDLFHPVRHHIQYVVFQTTLTKRTIYECLFNFNNLYPKWDNPVHIQVYNVYEGKCYELQFYHTPRMPFYQFLTCMSGQSFVHLRFLYSLGVDGDYALYTPDLDLWVTGDLQSRLLEWSQMCHFLTFIAFHDTSEFQSRFLEDSKQNITFQCRSLRKILLSIDGASRSHSVSKYFQKVFCRPPLGESPLHHVQMMLQLIDHFAIFSQHLI